MNMEHRAEDIKNIENLEYKKNPKDTIIRKPEWLKIRLPHGKNIKEVVTLLNEYHLNTICSSGLFPNKAECWGRKTATFMIGGNICTRNCRFCNVSHGKPLPIRESEITEIVTSIKNLGLRHVVLTSVDRDDLNDLGAGHWSKLIKTIKKELPSVTIEALIPDFQGKKELIDLVIESKPDIISHNLETVERLTHKVRTFATYENSLSVVEHITQSGIRSKSGIMLGLGETEEEIFQTMDDLLSTGCRIMTIGQYLQPSKNHYPVKEYIHPDKFEEYRQIGLRKGFRHLESGPFVRSSFHADKHLS